MSYTFTFSGRESILTSKIYPPIILEENASYVMGLIDLMTFNTIPNIDDSNNIFYIGNYNIKIPKGTYEITDIEKKLKSLIKEEDDKNQMKTSTGKFTSTVLSLKANHNTFKCEIKCNKDIDFRKSETIGKLLGFEEKKLVANKKHYSLHPISITKVNCICIECNLIHNSFNNDVSGHIIHMFYPNVPPGFKIVENPTNVIYLPINTRYINEITLKITDQHGNLVNFQEELVTVRLHLKKVT